MELHRREFLVGSLAAAVTGTLAAEQEDTAESVEFMPLTAEQVDTRMKELRELRTELQKARLVLEGTGKKRDEIREKYESKYGTIQNPTLRIRSDYQQPAYNPKRHDIPLVEKDEQYDESLFAGSKSMNELISLLKTYAKTANKGVSDTMLPALESLRNNDKRLPHTFHYGGDTPIEAESLEEYLTMMKLIFDADSKFIDSEFTILDVQKRYELIETLRRDYPELLRTDYTVDDIHNALSPALLKIYDGYPDVFPRLELDPDLSTMQARVGGEDSQHTAAFHDPANDVIHLAGDTPFYQQLIAYCHEAGHPFARTSEEYRFHPLRTEEDLSLIDSSIELIQNIMPALAYLREYQNAELQKRVLDVTSLLAVSLSQMAHRGTSRDILKGIDPTEVHSQIDEAVAYLMQEILLSEMCKDDTSLADILMQLRDIENRLSHIDVAHYGSYRYAEQYARETLNTLECAEILAMVRSPERLAQIHEEIKAYTEKRGIGTVAEIGKWERTFNRGNRTFEDSFSQLTFDSDLEREAIERADDPTFKVDIAQRIGELDKKLAEQFSAYLDFFKP